MEYSRGIEMPLDNIASFIHWMRSLLCQFFLEKALRNNWKIAMWSGKKFAVTHQGVGWTCFFLPPFSLRRDFSFQNTSEHFAIRFRQSYLIWEVYDVTAIELNEGIRMAPNYPVNLCWQVIYWLVRSFRVVDVVRILHVWQIFVKKFRHFFRITEIPARWIILCGRW